MIQEFTPLKKIVKFDKGKNPKDLLKIADNGNYYPYLEADYFRTGKLSQFATADGVKLIDENDLIMIFDGSKSGEILRNNRKGILASTMVKLLFDAKEYDSYYLQFFIQHHFGKLNGETTGSGIPHLNQEEFFGLQFPKIKKTEQEDISLEIKFRIDKANQLQQAALKQKEAVEALQGALLREVFPYKEGDELPKGWKWEKIGNIFEEVKNQVQPNEEEFKTLPFVGLENVVSHTREYTDEEYNPPASTCFRFDETNILYGKLRPYLNKVYLPTSKGKSSMELIPLKTKNNYSREFLAAILQSEAVIGDTVKFSTGGRMPRADLGKLKKLAVAVPIQNDVCNSIGKTVDEKIKNLISLKKKTETQLEAVEAMPAAILREVFDFGKLSP
jgi:type I restriction enzyme S subunit